MASYDAQDIKKKLETLEDDDFKDAVQEDEDEGIKGDFEVKPEELTILRAELASEFPEDCMYLSDAYILSVASKPYSKDPKIRRPLKYSLEKLKHVMAWREEAGAPEMEDLVKLAMKPTSDPEVVENPEKYTKATALVKSLNQGSIYWHGFTKTGQPILWVRTNRKPWYPDVDAEVNALILMSDAGIRCMPEGVTDFVVVAESSYPPPPNPTYMVNVLKGLVRGYPDRLKILYSAPVSSIVQFVMNLLLPLMPGRLASKVCLMGTDGVQAKLGPLMQDGQLPDFFGGSVTHDDLYPEEAKCESKGGLLKFDYFGMLDRLKTARDEYVKNNPST